MAACIFCRIAAGEVGERIHEEDDLVAFRDANPQAPTHILIVPRRHIETLDDVGESDVELLGRIVACAVELARREGVAKDGYRLVWNCNRHGGQSVWHLHLHLLGGRPMGWPPG